MPTEADSILTLTPLAGGTSETSPGGVSTKAFGGQSNIYVFDGPWAIVLFADSSDPIACGLIQQT